MDGILEVVYDIPGMYNFLAIAASLILHIISLKKWLDNRANNEKLKEVMQTL